MTRPDNWGALDEMCTGPCCNDDHPANNGFLTYLLTTREAAARLNLTHETVRRYINRGLLRADKRGRDWFIPLSEIVSYEKERRPAGRPATVTP